MQKTRRFDHVWNALLKSHSRLSAEYGAAKSHMGKARRHAFRFAKIVNELMRDHHDKWQAEVASIGASVGDWMDDHFSIIEQMGDDRQRLMTSIADGMTESEYVEAGPTWAALRAPRIVKTQARLDPIPEAAPASVWKARCQALERALKETRKELREALRDLALLRKELTPIKKLAKRLIA